MRSQLMVAAVVVTGLGSVMPGHDQPRQHLNPMIDLMEQGQPVFGLYAPAPPRGRGRRSGEAGTTPPPVQTVTQADLATQALAYGRADFIFNGGMEGGVDRALPQFREFMTALRDGGGLSRTPLPHLTHPMVVKTPSIADAGEAATDNIVRQLNAGASGIMFVTVESAEETRRGLAAMRFRSRGGTRPDDELGIAPSVWGLSEAEYRAKADLWPLNPAGELVNWTIVESHEGLANVREIAAVPGIGVLWPGAGTLRGLFRDDPAGWEAAIQQVLAACKEFDVRCGYPANATDIERRMQQGFSVFVMSWGQGGFDAIEAGRRAAGR